MTQCRTTINLLLNNQSGEPENLQAACMKFPCDLTNNKELSRQNQSFPGAKETSALL